MDFENESVPWSVAQYPNALKCVRVPPSRKFSLNEVDIQTQVIISKFLFCSEGWKEKNEIIRKLKVNSSVQPLFADQ